MIYCVVPRELAPKLHEALRRHFRDEAEVEVVVERRGAERRRAADRRLAQAQAADEDRRSIRAVEGRRVADRRAALVTVDAIELPRRLRAHADRLVFYERIQATTEQAEDLDTARLVTRIQAGHREGYAELYLRYFDRVYGYLRMVLRDPHEAEDVAQQVFVRVLESLPRYERRRQPFRAWLFTIVRNLARDHLTRQRRLELEEPGEIARRREQEERPDELAALKWISDRELLMFIERLTPIQQQVLVLRYLLDLSTPDIAAITERQPNAVRALEHRALRTLEDRLAAVGRTPSTRGGESVRMRRWVKQAPVLRGRRWALFG